MEFFKTKKKLIKERDYYKEECKRKTESLKEIRDKIIELRVKVENMDVKPNSNNTYEVEIIFYTKKATLYVSAPNMDEAYEYAIQRVLEDNRSLRKHEILGGTIKEVKDNAVQYVRFS